MSIVTDKDSIGVVKLDLEEGDELYEKFEALREDLKKITDHRKYGNKAVARYAINKAYETLQEEEHLYRRIMDTKRRQID